MKPKLLLPLLGCLLAVQLYAQDSLDNSRFLDMYQTGRFAEAAHYLEALYPDSQKTETVWKGLGYAHQMSGNYAEAEKAYMELFARDSTSLPTLINLGSINAKRRKTQEAHDFYSKALLLDSMNISVYQRLSEIEFGRNRLLDARELLMKAHDINPANADVAYNLAMISISLRSNGMADSVLSRALEHDPENRHLLFGRAVTLEKLQRYDDAIAVCQTLLDLGADSLEVFQVLGPLHFYKRDYKECLKVMTWLENASSDLSEGNMFITGVSYAWTGERARGLDYIDRAIELGISPGMGRYFNEKGKIYQAANQYTEAVAAYKRGLEYSDDARSLYNIALIYDYNLNRPKESLPFYKRFIEMNTAEVNQDISDFVKGRIEQLEGE
jgi:tetratricopeptide (TPR) repeat protein